MNRAYALTLTITLCGCGARVVEAPAESDAATVAADTMVPSSPADTSPNGVIVSDAGGPVTDAAPTEDTTTEPKPDPGDGPRITSFDACGSDTAVDKLIAHTSEGVRFMASAISVTPGGTTCSEIYPGMSSDGEYAFSARCGLVDKTKPITVVVRAGVMGLSGKQMAPGTYTFVPTGKTGRLCGSDFRPAP